MVLTLQRPTGADRRAGLIRRRALISLGAAGLVAGGAVAADLGAAAYCYGPEYLWRLYVWRTYHANDGDRFPARAFTASPNPIALADNRTAAPRIQAAFAAASGTDDPDAFAARTRTSSLIVLRDGRIEFERYFGGATRSTPQGSFSMAKSITSALVGAAIAERVLPDVETRVDGLVPDAKHLRGTDVRIRHLLQMSSGFALRGQPFPGPLGRPWSDWEINYFATNLRQVALAVRPAYPPGTYFQYDDRNPMLLGIMLERATGLHVTEYLQRRIWHPMGAAFPASWSLDSRADDFEKMESGINAAPLDYIRFGLLFLRGGLNERGERVLPEEWVKASLTAEAPLKEWAKGPDQSYGYLWWLFPRANGPADGFAHGVLGQVLYVSRATGIVILRTGASEEGVDWPTLLHRWAQTLAV